MVPWMGLGKEWWTSSNWGLGISAGAGMAEVNRKYDEGNPGYVGRVNTNKFFVMFNTTYN